jgi:hypothetical protein
MSIKTFTTSKISEADSFEQKLITKKYIKLGPLDVVKGPKQYIRRDSDWAQESFEVAPTTYVIEYWSDE